MEKNKFNHDDNYITYIESGESAAVFITRDIVTDIDTTNKGIDIIDYSSNKDHGQFHFNYIIVELFNRKTKPKYPSKSDIGEIIYSNQCKYITWLTANDDIANQRSNNVKGPKYLILCKLENRNKGRWITEEALWNTTFNRYVKPAWKTSSCIIRKRKRYIPPEKNDWFYEVKGVKKLSDKNYKRIKTREKFIEDKIIDGKELSLEDFLGNKDQEGEYKMEIYNDVGAANPVFGWGIFMFLYFGFILFSAGVGLYVLFLLIKFLKVGTRAFNKYLEDDK